MVFALGIIVRAMAVLLGGLVLSAPGVLFVHWRSANGAPEHEQSSLWAAGDLRDIAKGDAMGTVVAGLTKSPAMDTTSLESQLDLHPVAAIRAAMLRATAGSTKALDKELASFAATYDPASVCASAVDSAESDGPALCEAGCSLKAHAFDLSKPHPGACRALCAVAMETCQEETWATVLSITWVTWDTIDIAGHDLRTLLLTLLCSFWISRAIACREDRADNSRGSGSNSRGEEGGADNAGEVGAFDRSFGGGDPAVYGAFGDMQWRLANAEATMANMRGQIAAEREQMRRSMNALRDAFVGSRRQ